MKHIPALMLLLLIVILNFLSHEKSRKYQIQLEEAKLIIEKLEADNQDLSENPGGFVLLNEKVTSLKFENFKGEITWYQTYDREKLRSEYSSVNFHPIKNEKLSDGVPLRIPDNAHAFLLKGEVTGENYSLIYEY